MEEVPTISLSPDSSQMVGPLMAIFGTAFLFFMLVMAVVVLVLILAYWKIFTKAGKPGWAALIPIYNQYTLLQIVGRPGWWLILFFIPLVNYVVIILLALDLARSFGKSDTFAIVGLILFSLVGYPILGFGDAKYIGPSVKKTS